MRNIGGVSSRNKEYKKGIQEKEIVLEMQGIYGI